MNRFEVERHVGRADLPGPDKAVLRTLCTRMDADTGLIPDRFTLSLRQLARQSGYDRSTICRVLARLERAGWLTRIRPPLDLARRYHMRTTYEVTVPFFYQKAGRTLPDELAAYDDGTGRTAPDELAAPGNAAGRAAPPNPSIPSPDHPRTDIVIQAEDDLARAAQDEIWQLTGRPASLADGREAVRLVLTGRKARNPRQYLLRAIRADPQRFAPRPAGPVPYPQLAAEQAAAIARSDEQGSTQ